MKRLVSPLAVGLAVALLAPAVGAAELVPDPTAGWNLLFKHILIDLMIIGGIFGVIFLYLLIAYRAKSPDAVGDAPKLSVAQSWGWALIPAALFLADDFYLAANGWSLWNVYRTVPENAMEVKITARQWMWEVDYGNGVSLPLGFGQNDGEMAKFPAGKPVVFRMNAEDVVHSLFLPEYRVKEQVMPGRITHFWWLPKQLGQTVVECTEFCGLQHSLMVGHVEVVPQADFDAWLKSKKQHAEQAAADKKA